MKSRKLGINQSSFVEQQQDSDQLLRALTDTMTALISCEDDSTNNSVILEKLSTKAAQKYTEDDTVGHGGMKKILKVRDRDTARDVAMAVLHSDFTPRQINRFIHEARIIANLEHPNIVPVYDIGADDTKTPFFTMKLIHGEDLGKILQSQADGEEDYIKRYPLSRLLEIFQKVCDALAFAHSKKIIHLDLKPDNILIGSYGEVLVLDWGLAKVLGAQEPAIDEDFDPTITLHQRLEPSSIEVTQDGFIKGTAGFMAPEQAQGRTGEKDHRTDIYALGGILYSILTLEMPVKGYDFDDIIDNTIKGNIVPPSKTSSSKRVIPKALEAITLKAMALKPDNRYQSVSELRQDIDAYIAGFITTAENASFIKYLFMLIKRHKSEFTLILCSFMLLLITVSIFMFKIDQEKQRFYEKEKQIKAKEQEYIENLEKFRKQQIIRQRLTKRKAPWFINAAKASLTKSNTEEALVAAETAASLAPDSWQAQLLVGYLYFCEQNLAKAEDAFLLAERLVPTSNQKAIDWLAEYILVTQNLLIAKQSNKISIEEFKEAIRTKLNDKRIIDLISL